jgi:hypothetical protein
MERWEKVSPGLGQRWTAARPTKTLVFWSWAACAAVTMIVGFTWGGWVTRSTAQNLAEQTVITRLAPICVVQFKRDPAKDEKLQELKDTGRWQGGDYVMKQGWATMPGETEAASQVADECARLIIGMQA